MQIEPDIGLLLPCNVTVRREDGTTLVSVLDPQIMVRLPDEPRLEPVADEASRRLREMLAALA